MPEPPPEPPRPGWSPPVGDMASEPLPPLPGSPTLSPGSSEITIPALPLAPLSPLAGASADPTSPGPPRPVPLLPEPELTEGGGATTLLASCVPLSELVEFALPDEEPRLEPATDGGGAMTFAPRDEPRDRPVPGLPLAEFATDGGGGTTLLASEVPWPPWAPRVVSEETEGGGATASCVPKSLPMMLLTIDPLGACAGGGAMTFGVAARVLPLSRR